MPRQPRGAGRYGHCCLKLYWVVAQVREKLQKLDGYFLKLADAMEAWIDAWEQLNPAQAPAGLSDSKAQPAEHALPNGKA